MSNEIIHAFESEKEDGEDETVVRPSDWNAAHVLPQRLIDLLGLSAADGNIMVGDGSTYVAESGATARVSLGLSIGTDVRAVAPSRLSRPTAECDFFSSSGLPVWNAGGIASGGTASGAGEPNHPGIVALRSSASANSGYYFLTLSGAIELAGGESTEIVFSHPAAANYEARLGFQDSSSTTVPTDGAWINISGNTLDGRTSSNSVSSTTGTSYTISASTWYTARITVNADATLVTFELFSAAGALLWSDTLATNIPTGNTRETGHGVLAYYATGGANEALRLDYMNLDIGRPMVR